MQGQKMQEKQEEAKQMQVVYRKFEQNSSIKFVRKNKLNSPFLQPIPVPMPMQTQSPGGSNTTAGSGGGNTTTGSGTNTTSGSNTTATTGN